MDMSKLQEIEKTLVLERLGLEGHALIFSCKNSKIATCCWSAIHRRMLDPTKKRYLTSKDKGEFPTRWLVAKLLLESNPIPASAAWRAQSKPCVHQDPEIPQRLSQTCLWVFECLLQQHGQQWPATGIGALAAEDFRHPAGSISPLRGGRH